ncbi:MAG: tripartite tricarboxylate transporter substrate binding protein [Gammaproteobacteria bacterium]|nr:tripartite tricarboxylate transporter substrate binding protein [Gammaproteobacteria bacterium]
MFRSTLIAIGIIGALISNAVSAADWPTRPVTLYIGYKAGGGTDTVGRVFARVLGRELGQQVNVVNKPGAGGGVASMSVARAKPDGYTLLMNPSSSITANPHVTKKVKVKPEDFEYAGMLTAYQPALVSPSGAPFNSFEEFVAHAKENPGLKYAALNPFARMTMQVISEQKGLDISIVPVKGGAGMLAVVLGGQVDIAYSGGIHSRHPDKIKAIVPLTSERQPATPDMPTLAEQGVPVEANAMTTLLAPKGTPDAIMDKLAAALKVASEDPTILDISQKTMFPIFYRDRKAAMAEMQKQWGAYKAVVQSTGYVAK